MPEGNQLLETQDIEWKHDWEAIVEIYKEIENLRKSFNKLEVSYLREKQQEILILNLEKYAWTLQGFIVEKYSHHRINI